MKLPTYTLSRAIYALTVACGTDDDRPALQHVNIRADGIVEACNGHIMFRLKRDGNHPRDIKHRQKKIPDIGLMVHRKALENVRRIQHDADADIHHDRETIEISTGMGTITMQRNTHQGDSYPKTDELDRDLIDRTHRAVFSLDEMENFIRTMRRMFPKKWWQSRAAIPIAFDFYNEPDVKTTSKKGVRFSTSYDTISGEQVSGIIMQCTDFESGGDRT